MQKIDCTFSIFCISNDKKITQGVFLFKQSIKCKLFDHMSSHNFRVFVLILWSWIRSLHSCYEAQGISYWESLLLSTKYLFRRGLFACTEFKIEFTGIKVYMKKVNWDAYHFLMMNTSYIMLFLRTLSSCWLAITNYFKVYAHWKV